jgi:GNAT superfamily N-acetyltransferase
MLIPRLQSAVNNQFDGAHMECKIRKAEQRDIPIIVEFRMRMFHSFLGDTFDMAETAAFERDHLAEWLENGQFAAWVAEDGNGRVIAGAGISFYTLPPKPWNLHGRHAFVSSMYTEPEYRKKGIGGRLLKEALDFARDQGVETVTLHASKVAHSLYASFGFKDTNEMRLQLTP